MRNNRWIKPLLLCGLLAACIAVFVVIYKHGSDQETVDTTPAAVLQTAFPDKPAQSPLASDYRQIAENDKLQLRLKEDTLAIQVVNKQSGYVWSSDMVKPDANETWLNFIQSGVSIDYFDKENNNAIRTDLLTETNKTIQIKPIDQGFQATIRFNDLKIGLDLIVKLDGGQLVVRIPQKSVLEGEQFKLGSVLVYPFLGATKAGDTSGYMFIPDGSGALIAYADNKGKFKTPYEAKIYGANKGIDIARITDSLTDGAKDPYNAQFPVFGLVHGENQHALFGVVEDGKYNAKIISYASGVKTPYNWTTAQFIVRESYLQPTSRTMGGVVVFEKNRNAEDMQLRYSFLEGSDASYIGMAKSYRNYLIAHRDMPKEPIAAGGSADIPILLDVLGAETEGSLFSNHLIPMTTVDQLSSMLNQLRDGGVTRIDVVYRGWNKGGYSGTNPAPISFESKLGSANAFGKLSKQLDDQGGKLYYYADYTTAFDTSKRFSARDGAAIKIDKSLLSVPTYQEVYPMKYFMSADYAKKIAADNGSAYKKKGIASIAVDETPYELFSERVNGQVSSRSKTAESYTSMMEQLKSQAPNMAMYHPNDYMLAYADQLLDVPMHSSQYTYTSEAVPFEQIVLKGYKNYFAEPINFFANPRKELLAMIETASYPTYYLTSEQAFRLAHTNSRDVFASAFADWKDNIVKTYKQLNAALAPVQYATIEGRSVLSAGVVQVKYSNGKAIIVNYNDSAYTGEKATVEPLSYKVIEVRT
ncbi:hypothetical protein A8990_11271 [Paenibacillus taihuensis]|uniref:Uncharacterized protein n=1 Tax=Paenibacillus taihuensis TaxID=1156355 RepID=A0A3D9RZI0_9BACL|nr:DUF5696 domain-containing protein [Paenibacillus taihuensis]REE85342.1 hypothetical protein A8990_11271 [Paenibacillus taihuensis]